MTNFLRKLSDNTCNTQQKYITQNDTYVIDSATYFVINATGTVVLNYTITDYQNQIYPQNITSSQTIEVYGYTSESVSGDATCPLQTNKAQQEVSSVEEVSSLIIYLVNFGIELFSQIYFPPTAPHVEDSSDPVTIIALDHGQSIILYNVSQSSLTAANFVFAPSDDNNSGGNNDGDFWTLESELGVGLGGAAFLALSGLGIYMYMKNKGASELLDQA